MRRVNFLALACAIALALAPTASFARNGGGGFGSSSIRSTPSVRSTPNFNSGGWGRTTSPAGPGYAKPSVTAAPAPTGYAKPNTSAAPIPSPGYQKPIPTTTTATQPPGYHKPVANTAPAPGYQKPTPTTTASLPAGVTRKTDVDRAVQQKNSLDALTKLRSERAGFKTQAAPPSAAAIKQNPIALTYATSGTTHVTVNHYYTVRDDYYRGLGWHPAPYVYQSSPSFGAWDALLWWSILDHARDHDQAAMAYNYANDPGYLEWRHEAERLAQTNEDLKAKLAALDDTTHQMNGPRDTKYLPPGMKAEQALAAEVITGETIPEVNFATGVVGTTYNAVCAGNDDIKGFKAHADAAMKVNCIATGGSGDNIEGFASGRYQIILAQADAIDLMLRTGKVKTFGPGQQTAYRETMWLLVRKDSAIKSVTDLKAGEDTLYVGPKGSGTELSFRNLQAHASKSSWLFFSKHNVQYEGVGIKHTTYDEAVSAVLENNKSALLVLMGGYSPYMEKINAQYGDQLRLVPLSGDASFESVKDNDGNYVYQECTMPGAKYPKLFGGVGSERTLCVQSVVVVSEEWARKNGQTAIDAFASSWEFTKPDMQVISGGVN